MEFITKTLGQWMEHIAETYPEKEAVVFDDQILVGKGTPEEYTYHLTYRRTYKEFNEDIEKYARAFYKMGIRKGDKVAIWATNYPQWLLTLFASARIGAWLVTVNTAYKIHDAQYLLHQSDTKMLVMCDGFKDVSYVEIVKQLCGITSDSNREDLRTPRLPFLEKIITIDTKHHEGMYNWDELDKMAYDFTAEEEEAYKAAKCDFDCNDVVNMQYTSGTTGFPKGVMLTHYNILNNGKTIGDRMKFTEQDRLCVTVPLFHCFGLVLATMASITHAATIVLVNYYSPIKVLRTLESEKCTALHGVPTMYIAMLEHPEFKNFKFWLRTGIMAGSPCPVKTMQQVVDEMGMKEITIVYGQTEASPGCTQTTTDDPLERRVNTVGRNFPGVETKIVDPETGATLGPGQIGEFCARGYNIMKGYYKMPEATAQAIDKDGWLHTGDLACCDEDGYYKITGRIKDMIIRGGENIYPKEIEDFIITHPQVSDVQVVGAPSKAYGEEVLAFVIKKKDEEVTEDDIKNYVKNNLAKYKTPSYVIFVDEFPMNAAGKILKYKLREMGVEVLKLQEAASIVTA